MRFLSRGFLPAAWIFAASTGIVPVARAAGTPAATQSVALLAAIDARSLAGTRRDLQLGADPNRPDAGGETPLMHAVQCACDAHPLPVNLPIVQLLLDRHATVDTRDKTGKTALFYAVEGGSVPATHLLLTHKADPNATDQLGGTPLRTARLIGAPAMIQILLAAGAKPPQ